MPRSRSSPQYLQLRILLAKARETRGLTQVELARRLGRPQSYVSKFENGERRLDVIEFLEVAKAMGYEPEAIIRALTSLDA